MWVSFLGDPINGGFPFGFPFKPTKWGFLFEIVTQLKAERDQNSQASFWVPGRRRRSRSEGCCTRSTGTR